MEKSISQLISQTRQKRVNLTYKVGFQTGISSCLAFLLLYIAVTSSLVLDAVVLALLATFSALLAISCKFPSSRSYCTLTACVSLLYLLYHDVVQKSSPSPIHVTLLASISVSFLMFFVKHFLLQLTFLAIVSGVLLHSVDFPSWTTHFGYYLLASLTFTVLYYLSSVNSQALFLCSKSYLQRLSKRKWGFLCDQSPNGILIVRKDFKVQYLNSTAQVLLEQTDKNAALGTITGLVYKERFFASFFDEQSDHEKEPENPIHTDISGSHDDECFDSIAHDLKQYLSSDSHKVVCFGILQFSRENRRASVAEMEVPENITNLADYIEQTSQARTRAQMQKQGSFFIKGSKIQWKNSMCAMLHVTQVPEDLEAAVSRTLSQLSCSKLDVDVGNIRDFEDDL